MASKWKVIEDAWITLHGPGFPSEYHHFKDGFLAAQQQTEWIAVETRVPTPDKKCPFFVRGNPMHHYGFRTRAGEWECYLCNETVEGVTDWYEVPTPPKAVIEEES